MGSIPVGATKTLSTGRLSAFFYFRSQFLYGKMKISLALLLLSFSACSLDIKQLNGSWKPVAFYEDGQSLAAPLDSVSLRFSPDVGQYEFRSVGFYREAGPFRVSGNHLFLTDTTEKPAQEHVLKVLFLSADTLKIQMKKADREQVLFLKKI